MYEFTPSELQTLLDISNSYSDLLRKIGLNPKGGNPETLKKIIKEYGLDETQLNQNRKELLSKNSVHPHNKIKVPMEDIFSNKYTYHSSSNLLKRLINEGYKEYKCEECGISEWLGKPLSLQLEHIDGNHHNNSFENLKILCPNCHSQTSTFAGKNVDRSDSKRQQRLKNVREKELKLPPISRDELKQSIRNISFVKIGRQWGVTAKVVRGWCKKYKLPNKVCDVKKFTDEEWESI